MKRIVVYLLAMLNGLCSCAPDEKMVTATPESEEKCLPQEPPHIVEVRPYATSVALSWKKFRPACYPTSQYKYFLKWASEFANGEDFTDIDEVSYTATGFLPRTRYNISVAIHYADGEGSWHEGPSVVYEGFTTRTIPSPPLHLKVVSWSSHGLEASWDPSAIPPHEMDGYVVRVCERRSCDPADKSQRCDDPRKVGKNLTFAATGLKPLTYYEVTVYPYRSVQELHVASKATVCGRTAYEDIGPAVNHGVANATQNNVTFKWERPRRAGELAVLYNVLWNITDAPECPDQRHCSGSVQADEPSISIGGLRGFSLVCIQVIPVYEVEEKYVLGKHPTQKCARSLPYDPDIRASEVTQTSLVISWKRRKKPRPYRVQMRQRVGTCVGLDFDSANTSEFLSVHNTELEVKTQLPWTSVLVKVSRMPGLGINCFTTKVGYPSRPLHLKVVEQQDKKLVLSWKPPRNPNGPLDLYRAIVETEGQDTAPVEREFSGTRTRVTLSDLLPWTEYRIFLHAANIDEDLDKLLGAPTEIRARTAIGAPSAPRNVSLTTSERGFSATFQKPEVLGGPQETLGYLCAVVESNSGSTKLLKAVKVRKTECRGDLQPYAEHSLVLQAYQEIDSEEVYSEKVVVDFLLPGIGPDPVRQLKVDCRSNAVSVTWIVAAPGKGTAPGVFVLNIIGKNVADDEDHIVRTFDVYPNETCHQQSCTVVLDDLPPNYSYEIGVEAKNAWSEGTSERVSTRRDCLVSPGKGNGHKSSCGFLLISALAMFGTL